MPLKLNVGLMKKIGQPRYGSLSASCRLEIELDASLLDGEPDGLQDRAQRTFAVCRRAVEAELAFGDLRKRQSPSSMLAAAERLLGDEAAQCGESQDGTAADRTANKVAATNGAGKHEPVAGERRPSGEAPWQPASASQLGYVRRLASQIGRAAVLRVEVLARRRFSEPLAELSRGEANRLINILRAVKAGRLDGEQLWEESAA